MTIYTSNYTLGSNQPLNHARILYTPITGSIVANGLVGTNPEYALNDYTSQRWKLQPGPNSWDLVTPTNVQVDSVFIAAHNLAGKTISIQGSPYADAIGPDLVTNGTFTTNTNGWVAGNGATLAVDSARLRVTNGSFGNATQTIPSIVGRTYLVRATVTNGTGTGVIAFGTPASFDAYGAFGAGTIETTVVATGTTLQITAYVNSAVAVQTAFFDNISVQLTDFQSFRLPYTVPDNSTFCALFNDFGAPFVIRRLRVYVNDGTDVAIGIIRAGVSLQMPIPIYGGHRPLNLNRVTEAQQQFSETGQWLGRIIKRRAVTSAYEWEYLTPSWYDANFEPFAQTLPLNPFCIAGNPSKITSDVGFVWTDKDVEPVQMGIQAFRSVSLNVTGYY